jgi:hypothetical protein
LSAQQTFSASYMPSSRGTDLARRFCRQSQFMPQHPISAGSAGHRAACGGERRRSKGSGDDGAPPAFGLHQPRARGFQPRPGYRAHKHGPRMGRKRSFSSQATRELALHQTGSRRHSDPSNFAVCANRSRARSPVCSVKRNPRGGVGRRRGGSVSVMPNRDAPRVAHQMGFGTRPLATKLMAALTRASSH